MFNGIYPFGVIKHGYCKWMQICICFRAFPTAMSVTGGYWFQPGQNGRWKRIDLHFSKLWQNRNKIRMWFLVCLSSWATSEKRVASNMFGYRSVDFNPMGLVCQPVACVAWRQRVASPLRPVSSTHKCSAAVMMKLSVKKKDMIGIWNDVGLFMFIYLWLYMIIYDYLWLFMIIDDLWWFMMMIIYDYIWLFIIMYDYLWWYTKTLLVKLANATPSLAKAHPKKNAIVPLPFCWETDFPPHPWRYAWETRWWPWWFFYG